MLGAIIGDIIGSVYEKSGMKKTDFPLFDRDCRFTDDTVMTLAIADALMHKRMFRTNIRTFGLNYPNRGYGGMFREWLQTENAKPYHSFGNGSAMRVSPVGFACKEMEEVLDMARKTAEPTHNHPEGVKGAQAVAAGIFLARHNRSKEEIRTYIEDTFGYNLHRSVEEIRPGYQFDVSCQGSVPESIIAFLDSHDLESAIRLAVSLGGDADTMAAIAGALAQAYYKNIPLDFIYRTSQILTPSLWKIVVGFNKKYRIAISQS
jgi:ADP-ribosyl-[dinitrogen reductase] hydrolase